MRNCFWHLFHTLEQKEKNVSPSVMKILFSVMLNNKKYKLNSIIKNQGDYFEKLAK